MDKQFRAVLLTGNALRHRFAAQRLARNINLVGIVSEGKAPLPTTDSTLSREEQRIIAQHFAERDAVEQRLTGQNICFPDTEVIRIEHNTINAPAIFEWVQKQAPHVLLLYGTSIVKPPLLETYDGRVINLHLGLSPYYRGSGTNFWPLVNREPECVGATIHLAVRKVDAGAVLAQIRPEVEISDRCHELGTKTIIAGLEVMPLTVGAYLDGRITPQRQDLSRGRVYRRKDFNAEATIKMWGNFETSMIAEYLFDLKARCARYPILNTLNRNA
jgi:folate-dependent phosphoribosylglycinamide formyltransferase PurN